MPPRTNTFQRLIKLIHDQLADHGAEVRESLMVRDRLAGIEREIDVAIVSSQHGYPSVVAIECRAHSRLATVGWIDELHGKYQNMAVQRVVAVSAAGFRPAARKKAAALNIITMTIGEARKTDWTGFIGSASEIRLVVHHWTFLDAAGCVDTVEDMATLNCFPVGDWIVFAPDGSTMGTPKAEFQRLMTTPWIGGELERQIGDQEGVGRLQMTFPYPSGTHVSVPDGHRIPIVEMTFLAEFRVEVSAATDKLSAYVPDGPQLKELDVRAITARFELSSGRVHLVMAAHGPDTLKASYAMEDNAGNPSPAFGGGVFPRPLIK